MGKLVMTITSDNIFQKKNTIEHMLGGRSSNSTAPRLASGENAKHIKLTGWHQQIRPRTNGVDDDDDVTMSMVIIKRSTKYAKDNWLHQRDVF